MLTVCCFFGDIELMLSGFCDKFKSFEQLKVSTMTILLFNSLGCYGVATNDVSKQWSCDRCREGFFTAVSWCSLFTQLPKTLQMSGLEVRVGAETMAVIFILLLKRAGCTGFYFSFNNIILKTINGV